MSHSLVFDIGKTHAKALVFDAGLNCVHRAQRASEVVDGAPYPHLDVNRLWAWMLESMRDAAARFRIGRLNVATHGATAALVDPMLGEDGLVLPVLDYEFDGPARVTGYDALRPAFAETLSPALPAGLNLGRQLWWQQQCFPAEFAHAGAILMYPQYWNWRLSGALAGECTSLGCHTDLWAPRERGYSSLVRSQAWSAKLPRVVSPWVSPAPLREVIARATGLPGDCAVYTGVHDSNAGFARHLRAAQGRPFVLVSTGTWVVCMASAGSAQGLDPARDMLANVDVNGDPVACARFMGGREYARICELTGSDAAQPVTLDQLQATVDTGILALPDFSGGSGPCTGREGRITGQPAHGAALATLYLALMIELELELLDAPGEVLIEGAFAANPLLCALVATLCAQPVYLSGATDATALGAAMLCDWHREPESAPRERCEPCAVRALEAYRARWREGLASADRAVPETRTAIGAERE